MDVVESFDADSAHLDCHGPPFRAATLTTFDPEAGGA